MQQRITPRIKIIIYVTPCVVKNFYFSVTKKVTQNTSFINWNINGFFLR